MFIQNLKYALKTKFLKSLNGPMLLISFLFSHFRKAWCHITTLVCAIPRETRGTSASSHAGLLAIRFRGGHLLALACEL